MRATQIDFKSLLPYAIQAYTEVFGEEYQKLISDKINSSIIIPYDDPFGLKYYILRQKVFKRRQLILNFFEKINIDFPKHDDYTKPLSHELQKIIQVIIGMENICFDAKSDNHIIIRAFRKDVVLPQSKAFENKLILINYLRNYKEPQITKENFDSFSQTQEYYELLSRIENMNSIYDELLKEYSEWEKQFEVDIQFIEEEGKRKEKIIKTKRDELWKGIHCLLPKEIISVIEAQPLKQQQTMVLDSDNLSGALGIEYFSVEMINKLSSPKVAKCEKITIANRQIKFLKSMGCQIPKVLYTYDFELNISEYLNFLNREDIKRFIPSTTIIDEIATLRKEKEQEIHDDFNTNREDFQNAWKIFDCHPNIKNYLLNFFNNNNVCIGSVIPMEDGSIISFMYYTIRKNDEGSLFFSFMHEIGHVIEANPGGTGFDPFIDFYKLENKNPYDNAYRKYERFNETINDIFTIEAVRILQQRNVYPIESKGFTNTNMSDCNTSSIVKSLLQPLIDKFRKQVIKAKIFAQPQVLTKYIGEENFEDLVDVVNKIDNLVEKGLKKKIEKSPQDPMVIEYNNQLERIKRIYQSIDEYYTNYFTSLEEKEQKQNT